MVKTAAIATLLLFSVSAYAQAPAPPAAGAPAPQAQAAPQGPKNLKVLTGLTRDELMRTMHQMRASLGVRCEFCHAESSDGLDFASDAKKEKLQAREMIEMVKRINATTFEGRPVVSCYTCHRGSDHPVNLVPLPTTLPPPGDQQADSATAATPSLDDLIARYAKATGAGRASMRTMRGTMTDVRGPAELEVTHAEGRTLITTKTVQRATTQMYAGDSGWVRDARGTRDMSAAELLRFREVNAGLVLPVLDAKAEGWRPPVKEKIGEREAWRVERRVTPAYAERYWFDAENGVLLRMMMIQPGPVGRIPQQVDFSDYRDVGGVRVPFTIRNSLVDVRASSEKKFDVIETAAVDPKRFAKE